MALPLALGGAGLRRIGGTNGVSGGFVWRFSRIILRRNASHLVNRSRDSAQRRAEIGQIDHGKKQPDYPKEMVVREERQQTEHRHDLKLKLLRLVRHPLRQRMQMQIDVADREN